MAIFQILVRNLDGETRCLRFSSSQVSCEDLKAELEVVEGIPGDLQRLVSGTRELSGHLVAGDDGCFPSCTLLLRLRGGKGGFGSLLRGAATKAGQKKTSNFDACRDMSGRRLRHVNAEKKLKEWKAEAKERELEKAAENYMKRQRKTEEEDNGVGKELEKFRKESLQARKEIGSAVKDGLAESMKLGVDLKRKKIEAVQFEVKKARTWSPDDLEDDDSEEEDDQEAGPSSAEKDEAGPSSPSKDEAGPSSSMEVVADPSLSEKDESRLSCSVKDEAGPSSSGDFEDEVGLTSNRVCENANSQDIVLTDGSSKCPATPAFAEVSADSAVYNSNSEASGKGLEELTNSSTNSQGPGVIARGGYTDALHCHAPLMKADPIYTANSLDFEQYNTPKHLEILGLERLKTELQIRGLKCGGSLSERAARLFILKTIPVEKLDRKLFSKVTSNPGRK